MRKMNLRCYQLIALRDLEKKSGTKLLVLPTGAGKTVLFTEAAKTHSGLVCVIAHRQELVSQIALSFARSGVMHTIISPENVIRDCLADQSTELGRHFYDMSSNITVASVDSLLARKDKLGTWPELVSLWILDEAHHALPENKWGKAIALFKNAEGLGVTATPLRADGKALSGIFEHLIVGASTRELIDQEYLSKYKILAPPFNSERLVRGQNDFTQKSIESSKITGDVVSKYLHHAVGRSALIFCVSVVHSLDLADRFNSLGIPAAALSAKSPGHIRSKVLSDFRARKITVLLNVDLFGEGMDVPALDVVMMARPTMSLALYRQQFGRALRISPGKNEALIIDLVGNVVRHGLPDMPIPWTLDGKRPSENIISPLRACPECFGVYDRLNKVCPFCGYYQEPESRSLPEHVDGDLTEMDLEAMRKLIYVPKPLPRNLSPVARAGALKKQKLKLQAQAALRQSINDWAEAIDMSDSKKYRLFYRVFGIDVLSAQSLPTKECLLLTERIIGKVY